MKTNNEPNTSSNFWSQFLHYNPSHPLLVAPNPAIACRCPSGILLQVKGSHSRRGHMRELPAARQLLRRQMDSGAWPYPGGGKPEHRASEDYDQIETYRVLAILVEKYGLDRRHPAIQAAEYLANRRRGRFPRHLRQPVRHHLQPGDHGAADKGWLCE
jgi:hypothetical protein